MKKIIFILFMLVVQAAIAQDRIVTAGSSSSEIVCALGYCDKIVSTDRTSVYPAKLQGLPSIGYRKSIGAEGIIAQRPDLLILEEEYVKESLIEQLQSTGIKTLIVKQERSWKSTEERIKAIATALGNENAGAQLIEKIKAELDEVEKLVASADYRPTVLPVYARGAGNLQVGGTDSPFSLLELAGVHNAVPEIQGFKPLNTESLIQANPDYILFFTTGLESLGGVEGALEITGVAQTTAGKKRQIIAMDGLKLTNWGPRVAEAARELFFLTHPEAQARGTED